MAWIRQSEGVYKSDITGEVLKGQATKPTKAEISGGGSGTSLSPALQAVKANLQEQVNNGWIEQWQADAELNNQIGKEAQTAPNFSALSFNTPTDVINTTNQVAKGSQVAGNTLTNPNQVNPFGSQTVTYDPITGQPTVTQNLSGQNQQVASGIQQGGINANAALNNLLTGGFFGSVMNPSAAGGPAPTSNYEDAVFKRLTNGYEDNRKRDRDQLEQTLANRGIPIGSELYNNQMKQLDTRYDDMFNTAKAQAVESGTNAAFSALPQLSSVGQQAFMNPSFQGFQANPYQQPDVNSLFNTITNQNLSQQQIDLSKQNAGRSGGGGGSSSGSSPFNNGLPPGYPR